MTPQDLKNSILQLAIQGKLVEQRAEEGTGAELLEKIFAAKNAEDAKGKGEKSHAKSAKSAKVGSCVSREEIPDDEKPFDIPESWEWVRLGDVWSVLNGDRGKNYPAKSTLSHNGIPFISAVNLDGRSVINDDNLLCLSDNQYEKLGNGKLICGDIVVCIRGSLGKHGRYPFEKGAIASSLVIMRLMSRIPVLDDFLMFYLDSPLFFCEIKRYDNGTAQPNLAAKSLAQFLIPLPPLAEQKRIVAKIEELMPLVDRYEKAWSRLEDFNKRFPADMQKSLLQMAIQGKLVEQKADEGTGAELLEKILAAKNAEGAKGKGEKSHAKSAKFAKVGSRVSREEIPDDEKPFDIPESWEWARLGDIWSVLNGDRGKNYPAKSTLSHNGIPFISAVNLDGRSVINDDNLLCLSDNQYEKLGNGKLICGDIVVCIRGSLGKHGRYPFEKGAIASSLVIMRLMSRIPVLDDFLMFYLDSPLFFCEIKRYDNGTAQPNLAAKSLAQFLIPLPPLAEQKRIVAKLEELLPLCERLK